MNLLQAAAVLVLWRSSRFDTLDISHALNVPEADVCRVIHAARDRERGADMVLIEGGRA